MNDPLVPKVPYLPGTRQQNPAPVAQGGQEGLSAVQRLSMKIMEAFSQVLPSNYVSETPGPFYTLQFQSIAEQLAATQLALEEVGLESDVDFARPEYLWQMIGTLVFPDTSQTPRGPVEISGDLTYREFLRRMLLLLLQGSKQAVVQEGVGLLTEAEVRIVPKVGADRGSAWGLDDQFEFEVNLLGKTTWSDGAVGEAGSGFPTDPIRLQRNNARILRALRPAHTLYEYRHLFLELFQANISDTFSAELDAWHYEDFRHYCLGMKALMGEEGATLASKILFSDPRRSFRTVTPGATLTILNGPNTKPTSGGLDSSTLGEYRVEEVRRLVFGPDEVPRRYTTSPTGLVGKATVDVDGVFTDLTQDFSNAVEGEILTLLEGPNAAEYRLEVLVGGEGGLVGVVSPGSNQHQVQVSPSILRIRSRMPRSQAGQRYTVTLQRKGAKHPWFVNGEDVSSQFFL